MSTRRRQWNSTLPAPAHPMPRGTPLRSKPRKASEFARAYGSRKRVAWVKARPCVGCGMGPCENAHTETGGMGRKAGYQTIVPLCAHCHRRYHQHVDPFESPADRELMRWAAARTEAAWQAFTSGLTPLSAIVPGVIATLVGDGGGEES